LLRCRITPYFPSLTSAAWQHTLALKYGLLTVQHGACDERFPPSFPFSSLLLNMLSRCLATPCHPPIPKISAPTHYITLPCAADHPLLSLHHLSAFLAPSCDAPRHMRSPDRMGIPVKPGTPPRVREGGRAAALESSAQDHIARATARRHGGQGEAGKGARPTREAWPK